MRINSVQPNYSSQNRTAFTGGVQARLAEKLLDDGCSMKTLLNKSEEVFNTNNTHFLLSDVIYNAKEKVAKFFLSIDDTLRFIPGMENFAPKSFVVKGGSISEAFKNIKPEELRMANSSLRKAYINQFEATKEYRCAIYDQRQRIQAEAKDAYENASSFWIDYYKGLKR